MKKKNNENRNELLRLRYKFYRKLGYSSYDARKLRNRKFTISNLIENTIENTLKKDILTEIESINLFKDIINSSYGITYKEVDHDEEK